MNHYELTCLINGTITEEKLGIEVKTITDLIKKVGGKTIPAMREMRAKLDESMPQAPEQTTPIVSADPDVSIFKRRLSYPVQHKRQGYFMTVNFTIEKKETLEDFEKEIKHKEDVMRHIIIKKIPKPFNARAGRARTEASDEKSPETIEEKGIETKEKAPSKKLDDKNLDELEKKLDKILNI